MYESSCSYQSALDLKRAPPSPSNSIIKTEDFSFTQNSAEWSSYRFHQSTFEQLKQSVEKAKAALQDRTFLGTTSAFSDLYSTQRVNESTENLSSITLSNNIHNNNNNISINSNSINANGTNGSSQGSAINHNHSHSNGLTNQRLVTSQPHETSLEPSKPRSQSKFNFRSLKFLAPKVDWKKLHFPSEGSNEIFLRFFL
jgi:hypothetical protein